MRGLFRWWRRFLICAPLALALAVPPAAGASPPAASLTRLVGFPEVSRQVSRAAIEDLERELERESAARRKVTPSAGTAAAPSDVLSQAKGFYDRLARQPIEAAAPAPAGEPSAAAPAAATPDGSPLLQQAQAYAGVSYRWGGASRDGLDCSGLVVRAAADLGERLPHSAAALYQVGNPVAENELQPGDLVFFANTYKPGISHVGIYQGGTRFVQASSAAGKVTVGDLDRPYYRHKYAGARRLSLGGALVSAARRVIASAGRILTAPLRLGAP